MQQIAVSEQVHDQLTLLSLAWEITPGAAVERLLAEFQAAGQRSASGPTNENEVPVHAIYQGERTQATYFRDTGRVTITSGPLAGTSKKSPSGAAIEVVRQANPTVKPERNGWSFWVIDEDGRALQSIRHSS